ncbi:MAG: glycogen debranching protein GlgX [Selenomonadaceae bacterium]|nr:glycogen debranching protein GlgX [Selenomonadaceae bacterium]
MRIDLHPTDTYGEFKMRPGLVLANGAHLVPGGVNFSIYSSGATSCELVLFHSGEREPYAVIPFPEGYRVGAVFAMIVYDLDFEDLEYGFRMDGEYDFSRGVIFDKTKTLLDPYAKIITGRNVWGEEPDWTNPFQYRAKVVMNDFDWEGDEPIRSTHNEMIIYEAHVRGFTKDESSGVKYNGTYAGLREKIPYLKDLGVNTIELLPIFEFDEFEGAREVNGQKLMNYWGYSTVGFFAPKAGYAASGKYSMQVDEFKSLVKELHKNGIKIILDVVFNHTAEGNEYGPYISFKGIDNNYYYILTPEGYYYNFSGCGNTLNCNNPVVRNLILGCLRYWVATFHIDGFRFDLAAILGRNQDGSPMSNPPLLESLAFDPVLKDVILIAEAWDAGGLYQVGNFPAYGRWAEWNGRYRDDMRRFLKGEDGLAGAAAARILGSEDIYDRYWRGDAASVNFITCHDGFTLYDLYAYNGKHNEANGWGNSDGGNDNHSWNCGWEGESTDYGTNFLRHKMIKNAAAVLLTSLGVPMILAGDEFGNTQYGNNNPYCQDNKISWLDWNDLEKNKDIYNFFKYMIAFRKRHPVFMRKSPATPYGYPMTSLHGGDAWRFDRSEGSHYVGVMFTGKTKDGEDDFIYLGVNAHWDAKPIFLPELPADKTWKVEVNTDLGENACYETPCEIAANNSFLVGPRSVIICTA